MLLYQSQIRVCFLPPRPPRSPVPPRRPTELHLGIYPPIVLDPKLAVEPISKVPTEPQKLTVM